MTMICRGVFEYPAYFSVKDGKLNPRTKKFVLFGIKRNMKDYKLCDFENKKIVLSKNVTFNKTLLFKYTISQQVERLKTKNVLQWVEVDTTPPPPIIWNQLGSHRM